MSLIGTNFGKWAAYYSKSDLPWDTRQPSSQLRHYLTECPATSQVLMGQRVTYKEGSEHSQQQQWRQQQQQQSQGRQQDYESIPPCPTDLSMGQGYSTGIYHTCPLCFNMKPLTAPENPFFCLELACGTGSSCSYMAAAIPYARVVGVDLIPQAVHEARKIASEVGVKDRCAFLQADVFQLLDVDGGWSATKAWNLAEEQEGREQDQQQSQGQQSHQQHESCERTQLFDLVYDCQAFHALRNLDESSYLKLLYHSLKPGGLLMLLTGNSNEPAVGPSVLSEQELRDAFPDSQYEWLFLVPSRFDATPYYQKLPQLPLAWWGLLRKI